MTVTQPGKNGHVRVFPGGQAPPTASNLNVVAGQTIPNLVAVRLGVDGTVAFLNGVAPGSNTGLHLFADVAGYLRS